MSQVVYDTETYPNFFSLGVIHLHSDYYAEFECSEYRDDSAAMFATLGMLAREQVEMFGYNNLGFDYPILHHLIRVCFDDRGNQLRFGVDVAKAAYEKAEMIIRNQNRFANQIWQSDRFIPQVDLYKIMHFDNVAKSTSLKVLQFTMRAASVEDLPISPGTRLTREQAAKTLQYMRHDIEETKRFAGFCQAEITFRRSMLERLDGDVLNWSDVKIGSEFVVQRLGKKTCYKYVDGQREPRQTPRASIPVGDIIFPYITYERQECRDLLERFRSTIIVNTKASVKDAIELEGFAFDFGTGGVHGSVDRKVFRSSETHVIKDADVTSLYPSIVIENRLRPEHLGERFSDIARDLKRERQQTKKGDPLNAALKLALNGGVFGQGNNEWSPLFDPQYAMSITINGQLLLLMLAERLVTVPGLEIIQINTDGVTCYLPRSSLLIYDAFCDAWQKQTRLDLEFAEYASMFVRDVNSYIAVGVDGKIKRKGAYDFPTPEQPIGSAPSGPRAWHGDSSFMVVPQAANAALVKGVPVEVYIRDHKDPFDFMGRYKTPRGSRLMHDGAEQQRVTRYYVAKNPCGPLPLVKESPPPDHAWALPGMYKRKPGITDAEFLSVWRSLPPGTWDERIHTKAQTVYGDRHITVCADAAICNRADAFDWGLVDYEWYIAEAAKLVDCFAPDQ